MERFKRCEKIIGKDNLEKLKSSTVLVIGCGGVGGYVCEGLVRSGVGKIIIVDFDKVEETNINRQIIALESTLGKKKVDVLEKRLKDINSNLEVRKICEFIEEENIDLLFEERVNFVVDACDSVKTKIALINMCLKKKIKFISCMGTANRVDPSKVGIVDIRKTFNDPLARIIRKYVKDNNISDKIMVLFSAEVPHKTEDKTLGSLIFVPAVAGLNIAKYVVENLIKEKK